MALKPLQYGSAFHEGFSRYVITSVPEEVESILKRGRGWLFLEPLQQLKAGNPVLIRGNDFTVERMVERSFNLDTAEAIAGNFVSNGRPFRDER